MLPILLLLNAEVWSGAVAGKTDNTDLGDPSESCPPRDGGTNPIDIVSGNKFHKQTLFKDNVESGLEFNANYNSRFNGAGGISGRWSYSYNQYVKFDNFMLHGAGTKITYFTEDGRELAFFDQTGARGLALQTGGDESALETIYPLQMEGKGWNQAGQMKARYKYECKPFSATTQSCLPIDYKGFIYIKPNGDVEEFTTTRVVGEFMPGAVMFNENIALLTKVKSLNGVSTNVEWSNVSSRQAGHWNNVIFAVVTDPFGKKLSFSKSFNGQNSNNIDIENSIPWWLDIGDETWELSGAPGLFHARCDIDQPGRYLGLIRNEDSNTGKLVIHDFIYDTGSYSDVNCTALRSIWRNNLPYQNWGYNNSGQAVTSYKGGAGQLNKTSDYRRLGDPMQNQSSSSLGKFPQDGIDDVVRISNLDVFNKSNVNTHNERVIENHLGHETTYDYGIVNGDVKLVSVTGASTSSCIPSNAIYAYDTKGNIDTVSSNSVITDYTYESADYISGNLPSHLKDVTYAKGTELEYTEGFQRQGPYDTKPSSPDDHVYFDPQAKKKELRGLTIDYEYYANRRLKKRTETDTTIHTSPYTTAGDRRVWEYTYEYNTNAAVTKTTITNPDLSTDVYEYDTSGNLSVLNKNSQEYSFSDYTVSGLPGKITDPNNIETSLTYVYSHEGYVISTVTINERTTTYNYNWHSVLESIEYPTGYTVNYKFTPARKLKEVADNLGNKIDVRVVDSIIDNNSSWGGGDGTRHITVKYLDASGEEVFVDEKYQNSLFNLYRTLNQVANIDGSITEQEYRYDASGNNNSILKKNASYLNAQNILLRKNLKTTKIFNALNQLTHIKAMTPEDETSVLNEAEYGYDDYGNINSIKDGRGVETTFVYNGWNQKIEENSPSTGKTIYRYKNNGLLESISREDGLVKTYSYDAKRVSQVVAEKSNSTSTTSFGYDDVSEGNLGKGKMTSMATASDATALKYNSFGKVSFKTSSIENISYSSGYKYDANGLLEEIYYPNGSTLIYVRDAFGLLRSIKIKNDAINNEEILVSDIKYYPFSGASEYTLGNGLVHKIVRDLDGNVSAISSISSDGSQKILDLVMNHDSDMLVSSVDRIESSYSQSFQYNIQGMLANAVGAYGEQSFEYDEVGNRTSKAQTAPSLSFIEAYTYPAESNQLQKVERQVDSTTSTRTFDYDDVGSIKTDSKFSGPAVEYGYNENNQMISLNESISNANVATYGYNALGQRVLKTTAINQWQGRHFHYGQKGEMLAITNSDGIVLQEFYYLEDQMVALKKNNDIDEDGLVDSWEVKYFNTLARTAQGDADGDGIPNEVEQADATDPGDKYSGGSDQDLDNDGMMDSWEVKHFATLSRDGTQDFDGDGISDAQEFLNGTSPSFNISWLIPVFHMINN
jgi:YD repeat-containing protein